MAPPRVASGVTSPTGPVPDLGYARAWVLTDGKAGDEAQCLGLAEAMGLVPELRMVSPRAPFAWAMPWGASFSKGFSL